MLEGNLQARSRFNLDLEIAVSAERTAVVGPSMEVVDKLVYSHGDTFILYGLGDGSLATEIAKNLDQGCALIVCELDSTKLNWAFCNCDLRFLLSHECVKIVGPNQDLFVWLYHRILRAGRKIQVIMPSGILLDARYKDLHENTVLYLLRLLASSAQTIQVLGSDILLNLGRSIHLAGRDPGVSSLFGMFDGVPCVLVGSGPSLNFDENDRWLRLAAKRSIIICADSTLGWLLNREIVPDFVVSVDPQELTFSKYDGLNVPPEVSLVYNPACNWKIPANFKGRRFVSDASYAPFVLFSKHWSEKGTIEDSAHCQLQMGFNLAARMGASEIAFVGNDLCYPGGKFCASGGTGYMAEFEDSSVDNIIVDDIVGKSVATSRLFLSYREIFEWMIERFGRNVYQTSRFGLPIKGAINLPLGLVLEPWPELAENKTAAIKKAHKNFVNQFDEIELNKHIKHLRLRLVELSEKAIRGEDLRKFLPEIGLLPVEPGNRNELASMAWLLCEALNGNSSK